MPNNEYVNKVSLSDGTDLIDLTEDTVTAETLRSGVTAHDRSGAQIVGTVGQPDWEEDDTTDPAYILNKPAIIAGTGTNSIIEGVIEEDDTSIIGTIYITGDANATTFSYTLGEGTIANNVSNGSNVFYIEAGAQTSYKFQRYTSITASTITFPNKVATTALTNSPVIVYRTINIAYGNYSHSEGENTFSTGRGSHSEGYRTIATATGSHGEGVSSEATGQAAHAEGNTTNARAACSHSEGIGTIAATSYQHVQGKYNIEDTEGVYADIVGNGKASSRSNAYTLDWSGNGWFAGKVTVGTAPTNDMDVATKKYVDDHSGGSGGGSYHIALDPDTTTGTAKTGTAKTTSPNYTPSGDVLYEKDTVDVVTAVNTTASLTYSYSNYVLTISGVNVTTSMNKSQTEVVTDINGFKGSGVHLIIEEDE